MKAADALQTFYSAAEEFGLPTRFLSDNAAVFSDKSRRGRVARRGAVPRADPPRHAPHRSPTTGTGAARGLPQLPAVGRQPVAWERDRRPRPGAGTRDRVPPLQEDVHRRVDRGADRAPPRLQVSALQAVRPRRPRELTLRSESFAFASGLATPLRGERARAEPAHSSTWVQVGVWGGPLAVAPAASPPV